MRLFRRRLAALAASLSLVVFVATVVLWVRGYFVGDCWSWPSAAQPQGWRGSQIPGRRVSNAGAGRFQWGIEFDWSFGFDSRPISGFRHDATPAPAVFNNYGLYRFLGPASQSVRLLGVEHEVFSGMPFISSWNLDPIEPLPTLAEFWTMPAWAPAVVSAAVWVPWAVAAVRRRRRFAAGLCPKCGYDLRESKDRCPECGTAVRGTAQVVESSRV